MNCLYLSKKRPKNNSTSVKRSRKRLQSKASFRNFCNLIALNLYENSVKSLRVTKNVKELKCERIWNALESKKIPRDNNSDNI